MAEKRNCSQLKRGRQVVNAGEQQRVTYDGVRADPCFNVLYSNACDYVSFAIGFRTENFLLQAAIERAVRWASEK